MRHVQQLFSHISNQLFAKQIANLWEWIEPEITLVQADLPIQLRIYTSDGMY